jgi:hypothetical protein
MEISVWRSAAKVPEWCAPPVANIPTVELVQNDHKTIMLTLGAATDLL